MRVSLLIGALASARALEECALSAANECFACPEGARCSTYDPESPETLEVRTGFWRVSEGSLVMYATGQGMLAADAGGAQQMLAPAVAPGGQSRNGAVTAAAGSWKPWEDAMSHISRACRRTLRLGHT